MGNIYVIKLDLAGQCETFSKRLYYILQGGATQVQV